MRYALALALLLTAAPAWALTAVDGDTVRFKRPPLVRLIGFDTPETRGARCAAERQHGLRAKARLQELLDEGLLVFTYKMNRHGVRLRDKYGRWLAELAVDKIPLATLLIREGLAVAYTGKTTRLANYDWCANLPRS